MKKTIDIEGMSCSHCVMHVKEALSEIDGVSDVSVSLEDKKAVIEAADKVTDEEITKAIDDYGYEVKKIY